MITTTSKALLALPLTLALGACQSSETTTSTQSTPATPTVALNEGIGAAAISGSTYTVTTDGKTITLPAPNATVNGGAGWLRAIGDGKTSAGQYDGASTKMIAGSHDGESFAGITGTTIDPGLAGTATYKGTYFADARVQNASSRGVITLTADFAGNTVKGDATDLNINGKIGSAGAVTGEATYKGDTAPLKGGFYAGDEMNAVFNNGYVSGFVQTKKQ